MGDDEYHPISQSGSNLTAAGGIGYTVVDSLDTMLLGGLLSAYHLSGGDDLYLEKARDLGERLLAAFDGTPSGLPTTMINLGRREGVPDKDNQNMVSTAEVATLQLEFRYLAELTGREEFWERAENVRCLRSLERSCGR
jgi:uncharacterized protein YyaL (SSP411 family)